MSYSEEEYYHNTFPNEDVNLHTRIKNLLIMVRLLLLVITQARFQDWLRHNDCECVIRSVSL